MEPGCFVLVPFGPQSRIGIVWDKAVGEVDDEEDGESAKPKKKLDRRKMKAVAHRLDVPCLPVISLRFAEWIARYTLAPLGMVARMMMSAQSAFEPQPPRFGVAIVAGAPEPPRMTPARRKALDVAADGMIRVKSALAHEAGCSSGVIDGLVESGNLVEVAIPDKVFPRPDPKHTTVEFSDHQAEAVQALRSCSGWSKFLGVADRWRHRIGQDGGLLRGGGALPRSRASGGDHAARNRADLAVHEPFQGAVRLPAGRVAFRVVAAGARRGCGRRRQPARPVWWSALDRRFFFPTRISG